MPDLFDPRRDLSKICVVEEAKDVQAVERTREYKGLYHVLGGALNPIKASVRRSCASANCWCASAAVDGIDVDEVIIATDPNTEGEATAAFLVRMLRDFPGLTVTRPAAGLPMGAELEFADELTLGRAMSGRRSLSEPPRVLEQTPPTGAGCAWTRRSHREAGTPRGLVAVDGPSGAGKSTYAQHLVDDLRADGCRVALVPTDHYATWDDPVAWWPRLIAEVITPLQRGWDAHYRPLVWRDGTPRPGPEVRLPWAPLIVIEGVSSARRSFAGKLSLGLWLDGGTAAERLERAVARDGEAERENLRRWQEFEAGWFAVDGTRERCVSVARGTV